MFNNPLETFKFAKEIIREDESGCSIIRAVIWYPNPNPTLLQSKPSPSPSPSPVSVAVSGGDDDTFKIDDLSSSGEIGSFLPYLRRLVLPSRHLLLPPQPYRRRRRVSLSAYDADPFVLLKSVKIHKKVRQFDSTNLVPAVIAAFR
ncbi:hypothetical protein MIMGU_mgv1a015805mg [Erythranthe guttata]|uniref:Uncharacterized protein n=1 Tax=Erythranthe guttata TaxID=4155 RepID=A0A022RVK8_ERYGU|nr:hypothetical protein MIMGU_mgv1a015805mg [Erythranthe guttata]